MSLLEALRALIGSPPAEFAALEYVALFVLLLFLLCNCFALIAGVLRRFGG